MIDKSFWEALFENLLDKKSLVIILIGGIFVLVAAGSGWSVIGIKIDLIGRILLIIVGIGLVIPGVIMAWQERQIKDQPIPQAQPINQSKSGKVLTLFSTDTQTTQLIPRDDGLELSFVDQKNPSRSRRRLLPTVNLKNILAGNNVSVATKSRVSSNYGLLSLGPWKNWLYSKDLFASPDSLEKEVRSIIQNVTEGK